MEISYLDQENRKHTSSYCTMNEMQTQGCFWTQENSIWPVRCILNEMPGYWLLLLPVPVLYRNHNTSDSKTLIVCNHIEICLVQYVQNLQNLRRIIHHCIFLWWSRIITAITPSFTLQMSFTECMWTSIYQCLGLIKHVLLSVLTV